LREEAIAARKPDVESYVSSEVEKRVSMAQDFTQNTGLGRILQERLIDVERNSPNNWLDDNFWTSAAYHSWREPLPVNSNWWINCAHDTDAPRSIIESTPTEGTFTDWQVRRAAVLSWRLLDFKDRLER
jgi:carnitine O-acetyltransferase